MQISSSLFLKTILIVFAICVHAAFDEVVADWDYDNFTYWNEVYPDCKLNAQSPIDLIFPSSPSINNIVSFQFNYPSISTFTLDEVPLYSARVSNDDDGLTEQFIVPSGSLLPPGTWHFETGHFHWGPTPATGSEHTVNGRSFPMELHLIHRNHKYNSLNEAFTKSDGLLVLGILFQLQGDNNTELEQLRLEELTVNTTARTIITNAKLGWKTFLPVDAATNYATYAGSLTTPPCSEVVRWVIFQTPLNVSAYQLDLLRHIVPGNYRPTQPYNGRKVAYSWIDRGIQINGAILSGPTIPIFSLFVLCF